jgi:hypothetical protein
VQRSAVLQFDLSPPQFHGTGSLQFLQPPANDLSSRTDFQGNVLVSRFNDGRVVRGNVEISKQILGEPVIDGFCRDPSNKRDYVSESKYGRRKYIVRQRIVALADFPKSGGRNCHGANVLVRGRARIGRDT